MTILAMTIPQTMDATPRPLDLSFPDLTALLPFVFVCLTSVFLTTVWLLAVSRYAGKHTVRR
jgi:hypothetical protein